MNITPKLLAVSAVFLSLAAYAGAWEPEPMSERQFLLTLERGAQPAVQAFRDRPSSLLLGLPTVRHTIQAAPAQGLPGLNSDKAPWGALKELYEKGSLPTRARLTGWFSGRCFKLPAADKPAANLLVGVARKQREDRGPLFPPQEVFKLLSIPTSFEPGYYDEINDEKRGLIEKNISELDSVTEATESAASLASRNDSGNLEYRVRASGDYLVMRATFLRDQEEYKPGDAYAFCYYFKKVHD